MFSLAAFFITVAAAAPKDVEPAFEMPLWPAEAPGAPLEKPEDNPRIIAYLPETEGPHAAVVIFPGGGYHGLAMDHEGDEIGRWLVEHNMAGFVVTYRRGKAYPHPVPMTDAQRGIRTVRARAAEWKVDPSRIGVIGFSAGGHLAATTGVHYVDERPDQADPIERVSCRPDFLILMYPVITFTDPARHEGSMKNLLGETPDPALVKEMSLELQVTAKTPPTFLIHTQEDQAVPVKNALLFYESLVQNGVAAEMHVFDKGKHGLGLGYKTPELTYAAWPDLCLRWLATQGFIQ